MLGSKRERLCVAYLLERFVTTSSGGAIRSR